MAKFGNMVVDPVSAYQTSFGNLQVGTTLNKGVMENLKARVDKKTAEMKALNTETGGAGTTGYALIPVYVDNRIVDTSRKFTPWRTLVPRVTNMGTTADYNILTTKGGADFEYEDAALTESDDTYDRSSVAIKNMYSVGRVTGQSQSAQPGYMMDGLNPQGAGIYNQTFGSPMGGTAQETELLVKSQALYELEEESFWTGDASTTPKEYSGVVVSQSTTNQNDLSSAALKFSDIDDTLEYAFTDSGRPNIAGSDISTLSDLRKLMVDTYRVSPSEMVSDIAFGIKSKITLETLTGSMPVLPSQYLTASTGAKQLFFLDMDYIETRVLQDMTYEELAKTNDSKKFMLKMYQATIFKATSFNAYIDNIA